MISQEYLKEILHYDPDTGVFTWLKKTCHKVVIGKIAGSETDVGYIIIGIQGTQYRAHRLAFLYMENKIPDQIDHEDHDRSNNKWRNLNKTNNKMNARNCSKSIANTSGITGVSVYENGSCLPNIRDLNGKKINLGRTNDFFEACCRRKSAENKYGYHSNHGR